MNSYPGRPGPSSAERRHVGLSVASAGVAERTGAGPKMGWRMADLWDPLRTREVFSGLWQSPMTPMTTGFSSGYAALLSTIRHLVIGRELTFTLSGRPVAFTATSFDVPPEAPALSVGQLGDVAAAATDVSFDGYRLSNVNVVLRNAHIQPGPSPRLVAAPVIVAAELPEQMVDALVRSATGSLTVEVGEDGVGRLRWARFSRLGWLEVDVEITGTTLHLVPRRLVVFGRRWSLPRWVPRYAFAMPTLAGMFVTDIAVRPGSILLSATVPEWTFDIPRPKWDDVLGQLGSASGLRERTRARGWR